MPDVKRTLRLITHQNIIKEAANPEELALRSWSVEMYLLDDKKNMVPADCFTKAVYLLHESFDKPTQTVSSPPFKLEEQGWGEFEMMITLTGIDKGGDHRFTHDLNFQSNRYETDQTITFKNPRPALLEKLRATGPVGNENGIKSAKAQTKKIGKKAMGSVDMDKLADGLQKLQEDDLLQVVQMVHDNKSDDTYIKNDLELGEFHMDLYTLPDNLVQMLWTLVTEKTNID